MSLVDICQHQPHQNEHNGPTARVSLTKIELAGRDPRLRPQERDGGLQVEPGQVVPEHRHGPAEVVAVATDRVTHGAEHEGHVSMRLLAAHFNAVVHGVDFADFAEHARVEAHLECLVVLDRRRATGVLHPDGRGPWKRERKCCGTIITHGMQHFALQQTRLQIAFIVFQNVFKFQKAFDLPFHPAYPATRHALKTSWFGIFPV